ncbi:MAG: Ig-like domain-containing protein [Acidimicrobiales bacterium]
MARQRRRTHVERHRASRRFAAFVALVGLLAVIGPVAVSSAASASAASPSWINKMDPGDDFEPPSNLYGASMAYDPAMKAMVLYGGYLSNFGVQPTYDTLSSQGWTLGLPGPGGTDLHAGYFASMAYDPAMSGMLLYNTNGKTWMLKDSAWTEFGQSGPTPGARSEASMAYDAASGQMVLFGGAGGGEGSCGLACSDTWIWNGSKWRQAIDPTDKHGCPSDCPDSPPAGYWGSMVYDAATRDLVLTPGLTPFKDTPPRGTYIWNGTKWSRKTAALPSGTYLGSMAYDPATGNVVQFGGFGNSQLQRRTWTWNGSTWSATTAPGPSARRGAAMAYDPATRFVILFGGDNSSADFVPVPDLPWNWGYTYVSTATALSASANPAITGKAVSYTAKVTPNPGGGTVRFTSNGATIAGCGAVAVAHSTGKATCKITYRTAGSLSILASFSGHAGYETSKSAVLHEKVKVARV